MNIAPRFKQVKVTADMIAEQASSADLNDMIIFKDMSMPVFVNNNNKKLVTIENGKMVTQNYVEKYIINCGIE